MSSVTVPALIPVAGSREAAEAVIAAIVDLKNHASSQAAALKTAHAQQLFAAKRQAESELAALVLTAPMMAGAEYLTQDVLRTLWEEMTAAFTTTVAAAKSDLQSVLKGFNPARP